MKRSLTIVGFIFLFVTVMQSCKKNKKDKATDDDIFSSVTASGYTYYVGTPGITAAGGDSPHGFQRVRFNSTAAAAMGSDGRLPSGASFPEGSIIVKEIYSSASGSLKQYAVMKKESSHKNAKSGYLWVEYSPDGSVDYSTGDKGGSCISCHSGSTNRDLVRTFDLH